MSASHASEDVRGACLMQRLVALNHHLDYASLPRPNWKPEPDPLEDYSDCSAKPPAAKDSSNENVPEVEDEDVNKAATTKVISLKR